LASLQTDAPSAFPQLHGLTTAGRAKQRHCHGAGGHYINVIARGEMSDRRPLSACPTAQSWLRQFQATDRPAAEKMLDAMLLLNEEQVSAALRSQLYALANARRGRRRRVALYAERELGSAPVFKVQQVPDANGRLRRRAVGRKGPAPVQPIRG